MEVKLSFIPLIILLIILSAGCGYYICLYRSKITEVLGLLRKREVLVSLEEKSVDELEELLSLNQDLEYFEHCAAIRDELNKRLTCRV